MSKSQRKSNKSDKTTKNTPPKVKTSTMIMAIVVMMGVFFLGKAILSDASTGISHIGPEVSMQQIQEVAGLTIVDVRTPGEYQGGHIANAKLVTLQRLEELAATELPDKDAPLLVYCHSGQRSSVAVNILHNLGYTNLRNMAGGLIAWNNKGLPLTR